MKTRICLFGLVVGVAIGVGTLGCASSDASPNKEIVASSDTAVVSSDSELDAEQDAGDGGSQCLESEDDGGILDEEQDKGQTTEGTPIDTDTGKCPEDMVLISVLESADELSSFCMDRYEASRSDATGDSEGSDDSVANSKAGVLPWYENPMSEKALETFMEACEAAGKRICTGREWLFSCEGPEGRRYSYGEDFDKERCNSVDTYCDDYCVAEGISSEECNVSSNCGYSCGGDGDGDGDGVECFHLDPTGTHSDCTNEFGAFDVNGNLWEVFQSEDDSRGYEVHGGAFNCASASLRFACDYNAEWDGLYAGFRCCKDIAEK